MWNRVIKVLLLGAALAAAMQAVRLLLVEPAEVAQACTLNGQSWQCQLRTLAVNGFVRNVYGPLSLIAALLAWVGNIRAFAVMAMVAGMAGAVLYNFELSGMGLMLGALLLVREVDPVSTPVIEKQTQTQ